MDTPPFEHLRRFFERIKNVGFFERIFSWQGIVSQGYDAFGEFQQLQNLAQQKDLEITSLTSQHRDLSQRLEYQQQQVIRLQQDLSSEQLRTQSLNEKITEKEQVRSGLSATLSEVQTNSEAIILQLKEDMVALKMRNEELLRKINERENEAGGLLESEKKNRETIQKLTADISVLTAKSDQFNIQFTEAQKTIAQFRQKEEERLREHDQRVAELGSLRKQLEDDRLRVQAERDAEIHKQYEKIEQTWKKHEDRVEESVRMICQKHTIEYCDKEKFPYAGKPDNAVLIADQYIIFDAKSPKNSGELGNFPLYLRSQAELAKKYIKGENVKKEIFLVVPANTVEYLEDFHLDMADYQVYVVTQDCLEPVVLALRKIEEFKFVDKMSPEDRENICRIIGKFAHATKRRIQIDNYFSGEFISLLQKCSTLPEEILEKVVNFEKAEKMNPPMDKRKKLVQSIPDLEHASKVIAKEAEAREIDVTAVTKERIENIPLDKFLE